MDPGVAGSNPVIHPILFSRTSRKEASGNVILTFCEASLSPTIFRYKDYRFFFFSREETLKHVHVISPEGEAKFWLDPIVALAEKSELNARQPKEIQGG